VWKELFRDTYLDEVIRFSGRADFRASRDCPDCIARLTETPGPPDHRCKECLLPDLVCGDCCVRRHKRLPLHRIEVRVLFFPKISVGNSLVVRNGTGQRFSRRR
jgi:hypothetical protein